MSRTEGKPFQDGVGFLRPNATSTVRLKATSAVSFKTPDGCLWCHVTMAHSVIEAVREGMNFFADPFWRRAETERGTPFEVSLVGDERVWWVGGRKARIPSSMRI